MSGNMQVFIAFLRYACGPYQQVGLGQNIVDARSYILEDRATFWPATISHKCRKSDTYIEARKGNKKRAKGRVAWSASHMEMTRC